MQEIISMVLVFIGQIGVLAHLCGEKFRVFVRVPNQERSAETRRERRLRLRDTHLGARDFSCVTADGVVRCMRQRQRARGRQHAEGVARQKKITSVGCPAVQGILAF
jgi:hypothetical protein